VDTWVWHQVGLELRKIDVKCTIEAKRCSQRRHNLGNETVEVGVCWALNVKIAAAYIVKGLVIKAESAVSVLEQRMRRKHVVVRLDNSSGDLRSRSNGE